MAHDLDLLTDSCITAALAEDHDALGALIRPLGSADRARVAARLAIQAANALLAWGAEGANLSRGEVQDIWRRGMLARAAAAEGGGRG